MAVDREVLRDWHRLFGLLLTDSFTGSPFTVDIERDLSQQQQFLDVVIVRRGRGKFAGRLPDGLEGLAAHNLISFKSHHESLNGCWDCCSSSFEGRALPCRTRWRISSATTSRSISRS
jgi:hypothetical protein